jgi:hypothetical protein
MIYAMKSPHELLSWRPNSILPHIVFPFLLLLSFSSPPFRYRGILFTCLILAAIYASVTDEFPTTPTIRYALAGSWLFYIPVIEKLLLHVPEYDYWHRDGPIREAEAMAPFSWAKIRWAAALICNPRGVGWNHESSRLPTVKNPQEPRMWFVARKAVEAVLASCVIGTTIILSGMTQFPHDWSWKLFPRIFWSEVLMGCAVYSTWVVQVSFAASVSVGLGLSEIKVRVVVPTHRGLPESNMRSRTGRHSSVTSGLSRRLPVFGEISGMECSGRQV